MDPYDILPYESIAFAQTHPANLAVLGRLFGLETASPDACRVLEIGCASGGNLIPMAWHLPQSSFTGIDLSRTQVARGQALIGRLGISNIELREQDILDLSRHAGVFDYIVAHGVYSWVPPAVREHLLEVVSHLLAPAGLFYLSYNTLPGWRMRGMLRDILLYACREADTPAAKLEAARAALQRLSSAIQGLDALSAKYLEEEIRELRDAHPSYLFFEYLAECNQAFLFSELSQDLQRHALQYVCDTDLRTLFPSTLGEAVDQTLLDIEDGLELEQWLDFVTNRNFRQSVICRADAPLDDGIDLERFAGLAFCADLKQPDELDLKTCKDAGFLTPTGEPVSVNHPLTKAVLGRLADLYPDCVELVELMRRAASEVAAAGGGDMASQAQECLSELFSLYAHRAILARPDPVQAPSGCAERPRASRLALAQARAGAQRIATFHHGNLDLDSFASRLLSYLNGRRKTQELVELLTTDLAQGTLAAPDGVRTRQLSRQRLHALTDAAVRNLLALFSRYGVLES